MPHPSSSFSATVRVRLDDHPGSFARLAAAIAAEGGSLGAIDLVRGRAEDQDSRRGDPRGRLGPPRRDRARRRAGRRDRGAASLRPHVPAARGRQDRGHPEDAVAHTRRSLSRLYARSGARVAGDRGRSRAGLDADDQREHGRRRDRRLRRTGARRHRPRGRAARDGGKGDALQGVRGRRRIPDLPRHTGRRRDRRPSFVHSHRDSAASTSRTSLRRAASRSRSG